MNAYYIAAKARAWEVDQHVGRALDPEQPPYKIEAHGCGEGCYEKDRAQILQNHRLVNFFMPQKKCS